MNTRTQQLRTYYHDLRAMIEIVTHSSGFNNLGWIDHATQRTFSEAQHELVRLVASKLPHHETARWLEIGCGSGAPASYLLELHPVHITGIDLLCEQLTSHSSWRNSPRAYILQSDAHQLPFADHSFNAVYCIESAFHYSDHAKFIAEVARVLKPNGVFALAEICRKPGTYSDSFRMRLCARAVAASHFQTVEEYHTQANSHQLQMIENQFIGDGVARSLRVMAGRVKSHFTKLLEHGYSAGYLLSLIVIGLAAPLLYDFSPVEYRILTFQKRIDLPRSGTE